METYGSSLTSYWKVYITQDSREEAEPRDCEEKTVFLSHQSSFIIQAVLIAPLLKFSGWVSVTSHEKRLNSNASLSCWTRSVQHSLSRGQSLLRFNSMLIFILFYQLWAHHPPAPILVSCSRDSVRFSQEPWWINHLHDVYLSKNTFKKWERQASHESNLFFNCRGQLPIFCSLESCFLSKKHTDFLLENEL